MQRSGARPAESPLRIGVARVDERGSRLRLTDERLKLSCTAFMKGPVAGAASILPAASATIVRLYWESQLALRDRTGSRFRCAVIGRRERNHRADASGGARCSQPRFRRVLRPIGQSDTCVPPFRYRRNGRVRRTFRFQQRLRYIANALVNQHIGLDETGNGVWAIYFNTVLLATRRTRLRHPRVTRKSVTYVPGHLCYPCSRLLSAMKAAYRPAVSGGSSPSAATASPSCSHHQAPSRYQSGCRW